MDKDTVRKLEGLEVLAFEAYQFPWTREHVEGRILRVLNNSIFPAGPKGEVKVGDTVSLNITSTNKLQIIHYRYNEDEIYLTFGAEANLEDKPLSVVIFAVLPKTWKPGDKITNFFGLEAITE